MRAAATATLLANQWRDGKRQAVRPEDLFPSLKEEEGDPYWDTPEGQVGLARMAVLAAGGVIE